MTTIRERHAKMRAVTANMTNGQVIEALAHLVASGPELDETARCASAYLIDELTDRSTIVRDALDAWELDARSTESSAQVALRVARRGLYLHLHPDAKRAGH